MGLLYKSKTQWDSSKCMSSTYSEIQNIRLSAHFSPFAVALTDTHHIVRIWAFHTDHCRLLTLVPLQHHCALKTQEGKENNNNLLFKENTQVQFIIAAPPQKCGFNQDKDFFWTLPSSLNYLHWSHSQGHIVRLGEKCPVPFNTGLMYGNQWLKLFMAWIPYRAITFFSRPDPWDQH